MGYEMYMQIEGKRQGRFKGETSTRDGDDWTEILSCHMGSETARDAGAGVVRGPRDHSPVTIVKRLDTSSPQIHEAFVNGDAITSVSLEFVRTEGGSHEISHTIRLETALIAQVALDADSPGAAIASRSTDADVREQVAFTFQRIEFIAGTGTASGADHSVGGSTSAGVAGPSPVQTSTSSRGAGTMVGGAGTMSGQGQTATSPAQTGTMSGGAGTMAGQGQTATPSAPIATPRRIAVAGRPLLNRK